MSDNSKDTNESMPLRIFQSLEKLPAPLLLVAGLVAVALYLFLGANPPQVWPAFIVIFCSVLLAFSVYILDQRRKNEVSRRTEAEEKERKAEGSRREAEGQTSELRRIVEASLPIVGGKRDVWTRPMVQRPLPQQVIENILQILDCAVDEAARSLCEIVSDADKSKIRANIFLPTSEGVTSGDVCNLTIPLTRADADPDNPKSYLQRNMPDAHECAIRFRPTEGATGRVFIESRSIGVLSHPSWLDESDEIKKKAIERWVYVHLHPDADFSRRNDSVFTEKGKSEFQMTDFHNRRVMDTLAWIVSMPILSKIQDTFEVVGILNVDCLEYQITAPQLRAIFYRLAPFAGVLAGALKGLPLDRVAIFRFRE